MSDPQPRAPRPSHTAPAPCPLPAASVSPPIPGLRGAPWPPSIAPQPPPPRRPQPRLPPPASHTHERTGTTRPAPSGWAPSCCWRPSMTLRGPAAEGPHSWVRRGDPLPPPTPTPSGPATLAPPCCGRSAVGTAWEERSASTLSCLRGPGSTAGGLKRARGAHPAGTPACGFALLGGGGTVRGSSSIQQVGVCVGRGLPHGLTRPGRCPLCCAPPSCPPPLSRHTSGTAANPFRHCMHSDANALAHHIN